MSRLWIALTIVVLLAAATACWAPPAARVGDTARSTPHVHNPRVGAQITTGKVLIGAATVFIEGRPAARLNETGVGNGCIGPNTFTIWTGSSSVFIEGRQAVRLGDRTLHCGMAPGVVTTGAASVLIGG